jgi:hypothetical protein
MPFGIVLFLSIVVGPFLGWTGPGGGLLLTFLQQLAMLVPVVWWVKATATVAGRRWGWGAAGGIGPTCSPGSGWGCWPWSRVRWSVHHVRDRSRRPGP